MKKTNNKGFSLVELIVVVAIMAVLMIVVAPQFLRYVEKTRSQKDDSAVHELLHSIEIAVADEDIYNSLGTTTTVAAADNTTVVVSGASDNSLLNELKLVFPPDAKIDFSSAEYSSRTYTVTITKTASSGATVSGSWSPVTP